MRAEGQLLPGVPSAWVAAALDSLIYAAWSTVRAGTIAPANAAELVLASLPLGAALMGSERRIDRLALARFLALCGMVVVNYRLAMGAPDSGPGTLLVTALEGRAAATFVVLAGVGLSLGFGRAGCCSGAPPFCSSWAS